MCVPLLVMRRFEWFVEKLLQARRLTVIPLLLVINPFASWKVSDVQMQGLSRQPVYPYTNSRARVTYLHQALPMKRAQGLLPLENWY